MDLAHLLPIALLVCSVPALAQVQPPSSSFSGPLATLAAQDQSSQVTSPDPWKIIPDLPLTPNSGSNTQDSMRIDQFRILDSSKGSLIASNPNPKTRVLVLPDGQPDGDTTCYAIRSYVVARDSKDSDSTHLAGYSTCQRANRFRMKNAEVRQDSPSR